MTPDTKKSIIDAIILSEGAEYTNNPNDRGGPTKYGITMKTLNDYRDALCKPADVEALSEAEARAIYAKNYIDGPGFGLINADGVAALLIDWGVMAGPADAIKGLQKILNSYGNSLKTDGVLGVKTATAANNFPQAAKLQNLLVDAKILFHIDDVVKNPKQLENLRGWANRTFKFTV